MTRITVAVRTRPTSSFADDVIKIQSDNRGIVVDLPRNAHADEYINNQSGSFSWNFDAVLHNASQDVVYERVAAPAVHDSLKGINGTVLMYGQTGSGKTYTCIGDMGNFKYRGIVPRALADVYSFIEAHPENEVSVGISYLEIYNDQLSDLLSSLPSEDAPTGDLQICEDGKTGEISVKGQRVLPVMSEEAALSLLFEGETNRAVAFHQLNKTSTRGHAVFTVHLTVRSRVDSTGRVLSSKLNLVDLAGSERLKKTGTSGERMAESMSINRSLSYLEQLVVALAQPGRSHIPYRQSKLTHLLKDAIGGNCKTSLIACIYGEAAHVEETVSTLHFASRISRVKNNVTVNAAQDGAMLLKRYEAEVRQLKQELAMHDSLSSRSRVTYDAYTEAQQLELREKLKRFLDGTANAPELESVRMMSELLQQMKQLWGALRQELATRPAVGFGETRNSAFEEGLGESGYQVAADGAGDSGAVGELDLAKSAGITVGRAPDGATPAGVFEMPARRMTAGRAASPDVASSPGRGAGQGAGGLERNEAFSMFKAGLGADANADLLAAKTSQAALRAHLKGSAEFVNRLKGAIEGQVDLLATKRDERARIEARVNMAAGHSLGSPDREELIIDEEEYALIKSLKQLKMEYRGAHESFSVNKAEIAAATEKLDSLRASLLADFNDWFESGGGETLEVFRPKEKPRQPGQDVMDDDEAFDVMEQDRVRAAEPDSLAFFNATKTMKKRGKTLRAV